MPATSVPATNHIGLGLGLAACQKGLSVGFYTAAPCAPFPTRAKSVPRRFEMILKVQLKLHSPLRPLVRFAEAKSGVIR
jgi:hypothetical protein